LYFVLVIINIVRGFQETSNSREPVISLIRVPGHAKINQKDIAVLIKKNVLWLNVAMKNAMFMSILKSLSNL